MAPVIRTCPSCQKSIAVPPEAIGKKVRCSGCQAVFRIDEDGMSPASMSIEAPAPWDKPPTPPPQAPVPVPTPPASFDFGTESPADENPSNLDFSDQETRLNAGVRLRVNRFSNLLTTGGLMTVLLAGYAILRGFLISGFTQSIFPFFGSIVTATILATLGVLIMVGAGSLGRFRSKGFGMTAAILAIVAAIPGLTGCGAAALGLNAVNLFALLACCLGVICMIQVPTSLWGGIGTLTIINRDEINQAFQQERERQQRVAIQSGEFVPEKATASACFHAACWFGSLGALLIGVVGLFGAVLWRTSNLRQLEANVMTSIIVASVVYSLFAIGILLTANAIFFRANPVFGFLGSILSIVVAMQGFCSSIMSIPAVIGVHDVVLRPIVIALALALVGTLILGITCAVVGFSASNLLIRYRAALAKQVEPKDERDQDRDPVNAI